VFDDRLIEINLGEFEGTEETSDAMKLFWQATNSGTMGTERFKDFIKRTYDFCDMVMEDYKDKNVLIVTHAGNVRVINYYFIGKPKDYDFNKKTIIENGGLLTFENSRI